MKNTGRSLGGVLTALGLCAFSTSLGAQSEEHPLTDAAYVAGYKAAFICSATFNAGKTLPDIERQELDGIYTDYVDGFNLLPDAVIDPEARTVSVEYSHTLPPRIAAWRPNLGCSQLPPLASAETVSLLPAIDFQVPERAPDAPWSELAVINAPHDNTALEAALQKAFAAPGAGYGRNARTSALLIASPTEILVERYIDGFNERTSQRTWSVAKSIAASVLGAAVHDGILEVNAPTGLKAWQSPGDPRAQIQIKHLLHMASGLDSNRVGSRTDRLYFGGGTVSQTALQASAEATPGTRFKYANNDTLLAVRSLREALGDDQRFWRYPFEALFHKIGMLDTVPEMDWQGDFVLSSQVWTTARDLARLGLLHLNDGVWNGERILPEGWVDFIAAPAPAQTPAGRAGYGAQWWLYGLADHHPDLPAGTYAARGNRGQILMVIPEEDLVIVRRGYDIAGGPGFQIHDFARDVLAALKSSGH